MAKYLLALADGFIGSHLTERLVRGGHRVRCLGGAPISMPGLVRGTLERLSGPMEPDDLVRAMHGMDGCFLLDPGLDARPDSQAADTATHQKRLSVLRAAATAGVKVVFLSSASVYGEPAQPIADETLSPAPLDAVARGYVDLEARARDLGAEAGLASIALRPFAVYGPRCQANGDQGGLVATFARRMADQARLLLPGDGWMVRDFVYITDAVDHLIAALEHADIAAPRVNIATGEGTCLRDLVSTLMRLARRASEVDPVPAAVGRPARLVGDPSRAHALFKLPAATPLIAGLHKTLTWAALTSTAEWHARERERDSIFAA